MYSAHFWFSMAMPDIFIWYLYYPTSTQMMYYCPETAKFVFIEIVVSKWLSLLLVLRYEGHQLTILNLFFFIQMNP